MRSLGVRRSAVAVATGVVAVVLTVAGVLLVGFLRHSLIVGVDGTALARARDVATLAESGRLQPQVASTGEETSLVQVIDAHGAVIAASPNIDGEPAALAAPPSVRAPRVVTRSALPIANRGQRFRVVALPITLSSGPGWVYVATSLEQVDSSAGRLGEGLIVGLPVVLLLVSGVVWLSLGRALRPVERIRSRAAEIGESDLQRRVPVPGSRDEIARLAETMNAMLERLEIAAQRQRRFTGDASHELRSPLSALLAQVDVALAYPHAADQAATLAQVRQQAARMGDLIDDLLFLAHADETDSVSPTGRVDLDELVLAEAHRLRALRPQISVEFPTLDAVAIQGAQRHLERLLRNLGDNAMAHARTHVTLSLRAGDDGVSIAVGDDGPGIPAAQREEIFARFHRLEPDRARHTPGGGSGLGLAICREIARAHGGNIVAQDAPDGEQGIVLRVWLPTTRETGQPSSVRGEETGSSSATLG